MHKNATKCNKTQSKWCINKHGASKIIDTFETYQALLGKWPFRLLTEDGVWQTLLRQKYIGLKALSQVLWKPGDSHFWTGLMATKKHFFGHGNFSIKDGSEVHFWEDKWLGTTTL
jgi:hypothetical protein